MAEKIVNGKRVDVPIENHVTAALDTIRSKDPVSKVPHPNEVDMIDAKEHVDSNQK